MTTTEHLERIKAKCHALIDLAEKRTPGKWDYNTSPGMQTVTAMDGAATIGLGFHLTCSNLTMPYIAACAGAAEAGWRATIEAIEGLQRALDYTGWEVHTYMIKRHIEDSLAAILAAWPEELL